MLQIKWKPIKGYEGLYEVSNSGLVRSVDRIDFAGRHLKGKMFSTNAKGNYITCILMKDGVRYTHRIHRLVAEAFIPNPNGKPCVNHIDGNKQNNCVENLEWCTYTENMKHAYKNGLSKPIRKLSDVEITEILNCKGIIPGKEVARKYGVTFQWIYKIWKVGGRP